MSLRYERTVFGVIAVSAAGLFGSTFSDAYDVPSFGGDVSTVFTPRIFLGLILLLSALLLVTAKASENAAALGEEGAGMSRTEVAKLLSVSAVTLAVALVLPAAGFVVVAAPGMFLFCLLFGYRRLLTLGVMSILGPLGVWYLFNNLLELPLPRTPWFDLL